MFLKLVLNLKRKKGKRGEERSWDITENRRPGWMSVRTSSGSRNLPPRNITFTLWGGLTRRRWTTGTAVGGNEALTRGKQEA